MEGLGNLLYTDGKTWMVLAFIRVLSIRVYTFFPSELLEKM